MRKLLLQDVDYQRKLGGIAVTPPQGMSKLQYIESQLLQSINSKNPRLNVSSIQYMDIKSLFPEFVGSKYSAIIVDEVKVHSRPTQQIDDSRYYSDISGNLMQQRIIAYVFTSPATKNEGRNITVTQDIFPYLLDHTEKYINSPSYTYSNHPLYYISIMNHTGTLPASILENYSKLILLGIEFVELFPTGVNGSNMSNDVYGVINDIANLPGSRKNFALIQSTDDYRFDMANKSLKILSDSLLVNMSTDTLGSKMEIAANGNPEFKGSSEKFYWLNVLSMFELALQNNYEIDYSELWDWYNQNQVVNLFGNSQKFKRFESLLKYFDKKTLKG